MCFPLECKFSVPNKKPGLPKGYILTLECRLHWAESLLLALLTFKDPRTVSLFTDLAVDLEAFSIMQCVKNSPFNCSLSS